MNKKRIFLISILLIVAAGASFLFMNKYSEPKSTEPVAAIPPTQPLIIKQPSGSFNCDDMYNEIEDDLDRANYCQSDSDCSVIMLGGWHIAFGCYRFINKDVDQEQFFTKMDAYNEKCGQAINRCAPAPDAKCVSNKCVYIE